jgi:hypothetical protein
MNKLKTILSVLLMTIAAMGAKAAESFVDLKQGDWVLNNNGKVSIYVSANEQRGVMLAAQNLQKDLKAVCGADVTFTTEAEDATIVIGTTSTTKAYSKELKGKTEMFIIEAANGKLNIVGSDRRGAIYGIYELSQQIGVSPWYYWADAPIDVHESLYIKNGTYTDGEPAVKWRGLFLNDEAPCLTSWVKNTFGTDYGDHNFYAKVFELILRLKGNFLWPAMWGWAFYADDPENSKVADEMGIIMSTSHHEPMARNHQEYARKRNEWGAWNYQANKENLDRFFREGIERMKGTEDVVTIAMRGDGDEAMSADADTKLLETIVENQRKIIAEVTGRPAKETPQVWALYKEVLDYYDAGMRVPDDVCILLCDDNWGNVRRVPNEKERQHKGGWGLYYHVDYVGAPRNTKWLNVTQTQQMFEQLSLAYDFGIQQLWVLNVGDLKPMEYPIQLFMDMAWNPKTHTQQNVFDHTRSFFESVLGASFAEEAASIYNQNCQYMARVTPEMLDARTYNVATGEWKQVADEYQRLETRALRLYLTLPESRRDVYQQLILFPVQAAANLYDMYYAQAMNRYLAERKNPDANIWAEKVKACFKRDSLLCLAYNKEIAGGKWNGMMTQKHIGYRSWNDNFRRDMLPSTAQVDNNTPGGYTFAHSNGFVAMEAEHYYEAKTAEGTQWTVYPDFGRTRSAVALTPYSQTTGDASLSYQFTLPEDHPQQATIHIIVKSTLDFTNRGGHEYTVTLDGGEPATVNFNKNLVDRQPYQYSEFYPTIARRVVENKVTLPIGAGTTHTLTLHPKHGGIVFEKIVVDYGGYQTSYLFGQESEVKKQ